MYGVSCIIVSFVDVTLTLIQQMASLPRQRVNVARPFLSSGVDYCGPVILPIGTKRSRTTTKTYLAIFICMVAKAVHIEVVEDVSAQAFLDAFTRFISRRGPCPDLYSDNGTSFIGANRMLQDDLVAWHSKYNQQSLSSFPYIQLAFHHTKRSTSGWPMGGCCKVCEASFSSSG